MGNNQAGNAIVSTALALAKKAPDMAPLDILDVVCDPYRQADADFGDASNDEWMAFLMRAFRKPDTPPEPQPKVDANGYVTFEWDDWYDSNFDEPFRRRYELC